MKVYPGNLLMKAMGLSPEDKGRYYEAVFHLWQTEALSPAEMEARIGAISEPLRQRFDVREDGKLHMAWLDNEREIQTKTASKNSLNRSGKRKITSGKTTGKTSGLTTPKRTPVPVPNALPVPFSECKYMDLEVAKSSLQDLVMEGVNLEHYRKAILNWSDTKNEKRTERGWLATFRQWTDKDRERKELKMEKAEWNPRA